MANLDTAISVAIKQINDYKNLPETTGSNQQQCDQVMNILLRIQQLQRQGDNARQVADNAGFVSAAQELLQALAPLPFLLKHYILISLISGTKDLFDETLRKKNLFIPAIRLQDDFSASVDATAVHTNQLNTIIKVLGEQANLPSAANFSKEQSRKMLQMAMSIKKLYLDVPENSDKNDLQDAIAELLPELNALPFLARYYIILTLNSIALKDTDQSFRTQHFAPAIKNLQNHIQLNPLNVLNSAKQQLLKENSQAPEVTAELEELFNIYAQNVDAAPEQIAKLLTMSKSTTTSAVQQWVVADSSALTHPLLYNFREALILKVETVLKDNKNNLLKYLGKQMVKNIEDAQNKVLYEKLIKKVASYHPGFLHDSSKYFQDIMHDLEDADNKSKVEILKDFSKPDCALVDQMAVKLQLQEITVKLRQSLSSAGSLLLDYLEKTNKNKAKLLIKDNEWTLLQELIKSKSTFLQSETDKTLRSNILIKLLQELTAYPTLKADLLKEILIRKPSFFKVFFDIDKIKNFTQEQPIERIALLSATIFDFCAEQPAETLLKFTLGISAACSEWQKDLLNIEKANAVLQHRHLSPELKFKLVDKMLTVLQKFEQLSPQETRLQEHLSEIASSIEPFENILTTKASQNDASGSSSADDATKDNRRSRLGTMGSFAKSMGRKFIASTRAEKVSTKVDVRNIFPAPIDTLPSPQSPAGVLKILNSWEPKPLTWLASAELVEDFLLLCEKLTKSEHPSVPKVKHFLVTLLSVMNPGYRVAGAIFSDDELTSNEFFNLRRWQKGESKGVYQFMVDVKINDVILYSIDTITYNRSYNATTIADSVIGNIPNTLKMLEHNQYVATYDPLFIEMLDILLEMLHPAFEHQRQVITEEIRLAAQQNPLDEVGLTTQLNSAVDNILTILTAEDGIKKLKAQLNRLRETNSPLVSAEKDPFMQDYTVLRESLNEFLESIVNIRAALSPPAPKTLVIKGEASSAFTDDAFATISEMEFEDIMANMPVANTTNAAFEIEPLVSADETLTIPAEENSDSLDDLAAAGNSAIYSRRVIESTVQRPRPPLPSKLSTSLLSSTPTPLPKPSTPALSSTPTPLPKPSTLALSSTSTPTPLPKPSTLALSSTPTPLPKPSTPALSSTPTPLPKPSTPASTSTPTPLPKPSTPASTSTPTPLPKPSTLALSSTPAWQRTAVKLPDMNGRRINTAAAGAQNAANASTEQSSANPGVANFPDKNPREPSMS